MRSSTGSARCAPSRWSAPTCGSPSRRRSTPAPTLGSTRPARRGAHVPGSRCGGVTSSGRTRVSCAPSSRSTRRRPRLRTRTARSPSMPTSCTGPGSSTARIPSASGAHSASGTPGSPSGSGSAGRSASSARAPTSRSASRGGPGSPATATRTSLTERSSPARSRLGSTAPCASPIRRASPAAASAAWSSSSGAARSCARAPRTGKPSSARWSHSTTAPAGWANSPSASTRR